MAFFLRRGSSLGAGILRHHFKPPTSPVRLLSTSRPLLMDYPKDDFEHYKEVATRNPTHFRKADIAIMVQNKGQDYTMPHPIWSDEEADGVEINHYKPQNLLDWSAYGAILLIRNSFDIITLYKFGKPSYKTYIRRVIFLETVAAVPGFVAGMIRHLHSLRRMQRDHGWIHTLLEEAENERLHLLTFIELLEPGPAFRILVVVTQFIFLAGYTLGYLISPRFCHRLVGYLEEQAVVTYTGILADMDGGGQPQLVAMKAPEVAIRYWELQDNAMMRDVFNVIRADEAHHRLVNHTLGGMKLTDKNPFAPGY